MWWTPCQGLIFHICLGVVDLLCGGLPCQWLILHICLGSSESTMLWTPLPMVNIAYMFRSSGSTMWWTPLPRVNIVYIFRRSRFTMWWTPLPRILWNESVQCWGIFVVQKLLGLQLFILCRILQVINNLNTKISLCYWVVQI